MALADDKRDLELVTLLEESLTELRKSGTLDITAWQARCPEAGDELPELLETLRDLQTAVDDWRIGDGAAPTEEPPTRSEAGRQGDADDAGPFQPNQVDRYLVLEVLGKGGMGTVYKAWDQQLHRYVALKIPRLDHVPGDRTEARQRFLREARLAAGIRHPNVCPVYDAGEANGLPYVVMALIEGSSLSAVLKQQALAVPQAVQLTRKIAAALEVIHGHGIIHRDLKPGNVLLDPAGEPLITDFGLARSVVDGDQLTRQGVVVGTPAYMAPEQAGSEAGSIGIWTDLYSLGILLRHMLTGRLPQPGRAPEPLGQGLDPALEAIISKATAAQPQERYRSAREFGEALEHWSRKVPSPGTDQELPASSQPGSSAEGVVHTDLPGGGSVTVKLPSSAAGPRTLAVTVEERQRATRKRRRQILVRVAITFTVLLLALYQITIFTETRLQRSQESAQARLESLREEKRFARPRAIQADALRYTRKDSTTTTPTRPNLGSQHWPKEKLDTKAVRPEPTPLPEALSPDNPEALATLNNLAETYLAAGQLTKALPLLEQVLAERQEKLGPDHPATLASMNNLANAYRASGQVAKALPLLEETLAKRRKLLGEDHPDTALSYDTVAHTLQAQGRYAEAQPLYEKALAIRRKVLGEEHPDTASGYSGMASNLHAQGRYAEAQPLYEKALAIRRKVLGEEDPDTASGYSGMASNLHAQGRYSEAQALYEQALSIDRKVLGTDHPNTLSTLNNLARAYQDAGQTGEALPLFEQVLAKQKERLGPDHPRTLLSMNNLAVAYKNTGQFEKALPVFEQTLAKQKEKLGPKHPDTLQSMINLAGTYQDAGQVDKAIPLFQEALAGFNTLFGPDHPHTLRGMNTLGGAYLQNRDFGRAAVVLQDCLDRRKRILGPPDWEAFHTQSQLGGSLLGQQKYAEAEPLLLAGYKGLKEREARIPAGDRKRLTEALERLVQLYDVWGKPGQAQQWRKELEQRKATTPKPVK
jgi:serine/threonine protein kinase